MRSELTVAWGAALLIAGASAASAASLSGKPFKIDPGAAGEQVIVTAFGNGADFGAVIAEDATKDKVPETVYLQLFDAKGKPKGKKALVFTGEPALGRPAMATPGGALPLSGGKTLVGYTDQRMSTPGSFGGFFGQAMANGKKSGKEVEIDSVASGQFAFGYLLPLADGRGLAYWTALDFQLKNTAGARFVSTSGDLAPSNIDLTRNGSTFSGASPYLQGFITQHVQADSKFKKASIFARIYGADGKPSGAEVALEKDGPFNDAVFTSAVGMKDGTITVMRSVMTKTGAELSAQLYSSSLAPQGKPKVLAKNLLGQPYAAHPLENGDLLVGVKVADGAKDVALEYRRYSPSFKQVGASARIAGVKNPDFLQLVQLEGGDMVALYTSDGIDPTGQIIKP